MKIGCALTDVSPKCQICLTGFGDPKRKFLGVHDPIYITSTVIEQNGKKIAIVCGDVLGFDHEVLKEVREKIRVKTGISDILFSASHTHSAPEVLGYVNQKLGRYVKEYADFFYDKAVESVIAADDDLADGELYTGTTQCYGIGINRRRIINEEYTFAPFEDGIRNDEVTLIKAVCGGKIKALLYNFTCHPSVIGFDYASADYPGVCRRILSDKYGCTPAFLQGCCGNIRARTVDESGEKFRGGTYEDIEKFGAMLADAVDRILDGKLEKITGEIKGYVSSFELDLKPKLSLEQYKDEARELAETNFNKGAYDYYIENYDTLPTKLPYSVQRLDIGNELSLFAIEGEACVEYDIEIKKMMDRHTAVCGYSNGNPGYICTEEMFKYGGYEPQSSAFVYLLPDGFEPKNDKKIFEKCEELAKIK